MTYITSKICKWQQKIAGQNLGDYDLNFKAKSLASVQHIPLLRLLDNLVTKTNYYLIFEFLNGGDLGRLLRLAKDENSKKKTTGKLPELLVRKIMKQVVEGIQFLHFWYNDVNESKILGNQKCIAHRDLKPDNIMLHFPSFKESSSVSDEFIREYLADVKSKISKGEDFDVPQVKIVDFGLSREYEENMLKTMCGTPLYIAPEIFEEKEYDFRVDIWSIGAIIYKLLFGKTPTKGKNIFEVGKNTIKGDYTIKKNIEISYDMIEVIYKCLRAKPNERAMHQDLILAFSNSNLDNE